MVTIYNVVEKRIADYIEERDTTANLSRGLYVWNKNYKTELNYAALKKRIGNVSVENESTILIDMTAYTERSYRSLDTFCARHKDATLLLMVYQDDKSITDFKPHLDKHFKLSLDHFITCNNAAGNYRAVIYKKIKEGN